MIVISPDKALVKAHALCAKQERCRSELRMKLEAWGVDDREASRLLDRLEKEGFLNERRFAEHYAVSKLRQKGWGRVKIRYALREKQVDAGSVEAGLASIDQEEYGSLLRSLLKKCLSKEKGSAPQDRTRRVMRHMLSRGFEADLVRAALRG